MANHRELVLMHMKKYGSITHLEAEAEYGCARLASRINELRSQGVDIKTEMVTGKNKNGGKSNYARYSLAEAAQ
jgi:hypothetical protein